MRPVSALGLVLLLALAGCGGKSASPSTAPSTAQTIAAGPTTAAAPTTAANSPSTPAESPTASGTANPCTKRRAVALIDGHWSGPITMVVTGKGGKTTFTSSPGKGSLSMVVNNGKVVHGSWHVRWTSTGNVDTGQAAATLDVVGRISGKVDGAAAKPELLGTWTLKGTAKITKPVQTSAPVDDSGTDNEPMKIGKAKACGTIVAGTFEPSFTSKDAAATFTGKATWVGTNSDGFDSNPDIIPASPLVSPSS